MEAVHVFADVDEVVDYLLTGTTGAEAEVEPEEADEESDEDFDDDSEDDDEDDEDDK